MAKTQPRRKSGKKKQSVPEAELPQRLNYIILITGVAVAVVGMLVMNAGEAVSPLSETIAPLILVLGFCIIIPIGIIYRQKRQGAEKAEN